MVKKLNWVPWVAVVALVLAILALVIILFGGITGDVVKNKTTQADSRYNVCAEQCLKEKCSNSKFLSFCRLKNNGLCAKKCFGLTLGTNQSDCSPVTCGLYCPNGFKKDSAGCDVCQCAEQMGCQTDLDCPSQTLNFCRNGSACTETTDYQCLYNQCVVVGGGGGCSPVCPNGCENGRCLCVPSWTDQFKFEQINNKLNLGEGLLDVKTTPINYLDLPNTLKKEVYLDKNNQLFNYTQIIKTGNLTLSNFSDHDYDNGEWTPGFKITTNQFVLNYTLEFLNGPLFSDMNGTEIILFGNEYSIVYSNFVSGKKIILRDIFGNKIEFTDGLDVKLNDRTLSGLRVRISSQGSSISKINLEWKADDDLFLTEEQTLPLPAFNSVYFRFDGMVHAPTEDYGEAYLIAKDLCI